MLIVAFIPLYIILFFNESKNRVITFVRNPFALEFVKTFWLIAIFFSGALINKMLNGFEVLCVKDYYSFIYLTPFVVFISPVFLKERFVKVLLILISIECFIAFIEYLVGVRVFLDNSPLNEIQDYNLLYNSRVFGLSVNSSVLALKCFVGFLLLFKMTKMNSWQYRILFIVLILGILVSFNRAVFIASLLFLGLYVFGQLIYWLRERRLSVFSGEKVFSSIVILVVVLGSFSFWKSQISRGNKSVSIGVVREVENNSAPEMSCSYQNGPALQPLISNQFSDEKWIVKLTEKIELAGRQQLWVNYADFIHNHPYFGNGSDKLYFRAYDRANDKWKDMHAHNSFLMLISSHGWILSLLLFIFIILNFKKKNWVFILSILAYSFVQYGVFWGISLIDIFFFSLLLIPKNHSNEVERIN